MVLKQNIKQSEAKILIYLNQVPDRLKYARAISSKLNIGYSYLYQILDQMMEKGWLRKDKSRLKAYYLPTNLAPTKQAKEVITND